MDFLKKAVYYLFYKLNNAFKHSMDSYNEYKAILILVIVEAILLTQIIDLITNNFILQNYSWVKIEGIVIIFPLAFLNYHVFIAKRYWERYEEQFRTMSGKNKLFANLGIIAFLLFFIWFCFIL